MKGRDLVVGHVGRDEALRGVGVGEFANELRADAQPLESGDVVGAVTAHRSHRQCRATQCVEAVGDVARTAAEVTPERRHQERHVEDVQLIRKDLVGEPTFERHDGVERKGTANHCCHG